ncbi:nuclease-related domain-containing protein [Oceanobacillus manasiensis]|uniref:nuclease-related domain-containing protein n=1 Tax=Oceanobacillus manasiensis TaxID=586413 RepID=UPI000A92560D|nr:nuclease-related domain-containing protein [Oceanobacillus manasiensis]
MIIKKRNKTELDQYEALLSRIRPDHPKFREMEGDFARRNKGYIGERQVDYYLDELAAEMTILQDLNLSVDGKNMQIDNLLISPHAAYIVEVKNYSGTILFDTFLQQFTRDDGSQETGFRHPIQQAELQKQRLQAWLQEKNLPLIPIYCFIAISNPSTIIKVEGEKEHIAKVVAHAAYIPGKIMHQDNAVAKNTPIQHQKLGAKILGACKQTYHLPMTRYGIQAKDILPGVHCPACKYLGMQRIYGTWLCPKCKVKSKAAHKRALLDYFYLIKPSISNRECRKFLGISSKNITTKLLQNYLIYDKKKRRWRKH